MSRRRFFLQLTLVTFGTLAGISLLQLFPQFHVSFQFSLLSLLFFVVISAVMFLIAAQAALSKDKNVFTRLIMVFTFVKMLLTLALVVVFQKFARPTNNLFLIPFFSIYIVYTIFETTFMTKLGKIKAR